MDAIREVSDSVAGACQPPALASSSAAPVEPQANGDTEGQPTDRDSQSGSGVSDENGDQPTSKKKPKAAVLKRMSPSSQALAKVCPQCCPELDVICERICISHMLQNGQESSPTLTLLPSVAHSM